MGDEIDREGGWSGTSSHYAKFSSLIPHQIEDLRKTINRVTAHFLFL